MVPPIQIRYRKRPHGRGLDFWVRQCFLPKTFWRIFLKDFFKKQKNVTILALRWSVQNCAENTGRASSNTERRIQNRGHYGQIFKISSNNYVTFFLFEAREIRYLINFMGKSKKYIERRHGEPFKFLFLPKMDLLGSQASTWKKSNSELWATF